MTTKPIAATPDYQALRDEMETVAEHYLELADRIAPFDSIDAHNLRHMAYLARRIVRCTENRIRDLAESPHA